jgi:WD40 repeat protein
MKYHQLLHCIVAFVVFSFVAHAQKVTYTMETIGTHEDEVFGVFVDEEDTRFATSSLDETVKIWSLPQGKELRTIRGHLDQVNNLSFSGDNKNIATGSNDRLIKVWDVETGKELYTLAGHTAEVMGVYYSQDENSAYIASGSMDGTVKLWDVEFQSEVKTLRGHKMPVNNVAYSYDGQYIASCSDDKSIRIWSTDMMTKDPINILEGHKAPVLTALYSFNSQMLASSDQNGVVKVWVMPKGTLIRSIKAHDELVQDVSFAGDNKTLVTASLDKSVKLWDVTTGDNLMTMNVGVEVWSVDIVSDASVIVLGCADGTVRLLRRQSMNKTMPQSGKGGK